MRAVKIQTNYNSSQWQTIYVLSGAQDIGRQGLNGALGVRYYSVYKMLDPISISLVQCLEDVSKLPSHTALNISIDVLFKTSAAYLYKILLSILKMPGRS